MCGCEYIYICVLHTYPLQDFVILCADVVVLSGVRQRADHTRMQKTCYLALLTLIISYKECSFSEQKSKGNDAIHKGLHCMLAGYHAVYIVSHTGKHWFLPSYSCYILAVINYISSSAVTVNL